MSNYPETLPLITAPCPHCGGTGKLCEGCYADDYELCFCEDCDASTDNYMMGMYREGSIAAINDWNEGKVFK